MENLFDKDITIINKYINTETRKAEYKVNHVKGFWSSNNGISISGTQIIKADGLSAKILMNDSRNEVYQDPRDFQEQQTGWTLQPDDYLVKGIVNDFTTITKLLEDYEEVIKISNIAKKDYGSEDMCHFSITGA